MRHQYKLEEIGNELNSKIIEEGKERLSGLAEEIKLQETVIDETRDLIVNTFAVESTLGQKVRIIQAMFLLDTESYFIQLACEEEHGCDELVNEFLECVDSFEIK